MILRHNRVQPEKERFWGRAEKVGIFRKVLIGFLLVGEFSLAFQCQALQVAAKTQQNLSEDEIPKNIKEYCEEIGEKYCICPELLEAIAYYESRFTPDVKNGNCWGLMQINVNIHRERYIALGYTRKEMLDPYKNIEVAADLLAELYEEYEDNPIVLMKYAGQEYAIPDYLKNGKTTKYVRNILDRSERYERFHGK